MINPKSGIDMGFYGMLIAIVAALALGFAMQFFLGRKFVDPNNDAVPDTANTQTNQVALATATADNTTTTAEMPSTDSHQTFNTPEDLQSPLTGNVLSLEDVQDPVFSSGSMGAGIAIDPTEGVLRAPADGTVALVFPTGHAVGINTKNGAEILMHIGMDTVQLNGKGFEIFTHQGDTVHAGDPLVKFDIAAIKAAGYSLITPIVITNSRQYHAVTPLAKNTVTAAAPLLSLH